MSVLTLLPRLSEKTYRLSQESNTYVFDIPLNANKYSVKEAVESQFKVAVKNINIQRKSGKVKRSVRKRVQPTLGKEAETKRAYVTLGSGDKIAMFDEG